MTDNVVKFYPPGSFNDPDLVLEQAAGVYQDVIIMGWDKDGELDVRATEGFSSGPELLWVLEMVKHKLMAGDYQG